jgi:murein L,D-transpeptidase YcbB/YkuD
VAWLALGPALLQERAMAATGPDSVSSAITQSLPEAQKLLSQSAITHGAADALKQVYASAEAAPLWSHQGEPTAAARALLGELADAEGFGLRQGVPGCRPDA